ncbi:MAG TPA: FecR domain-containing protein, partial [Puia sp.]
EVILTGQGYFEVAHQREPFIVHTRGLEVHDLGTAFNVNAYAEEGVIKTTLLEGAVKIISKETSSFLKPGQQAILINNSDKIQVVEEAEPEDAIAWKNGRFQFSNMDLQTIMRQLTRWYDVDVVYEGEVPPIRIGGFINQNVYLSTVMEFLGENGVHFKMEGRKITILSK